jgi:hypothetical protein
MVRHHPGEASHKLGYGTRAAALLAALLLVACQVPRPNGASASDHLLYFGTTPPSLRRPPAERPIWLPDLPPNIPRFRVPDDGFHDNLG